MGREPCCSKEGLHRGPWSSKEDMLLTNYIQSHGEGQWRSLPKRAGLLRCGKSCRLRWLNYLRPGIKRGNITPDEEDLIIRLQSLLGNRWSLIAGRLPGRTDNEIKNHWNTHILKRLKEQGIQPKSHKHIAKRRRSIPERKSKIANNESKLEKQNDSGDPEKKEEKHELPIVGKVYFRKPIRISSSFTANSYNVSAGTDSPGSVGSSSQHEQQQEQQQEEVDKIPWSSFDLIGDDQTSYYFDDQSICNYENETFLIDYDFSLQDDDNLLKKMYDEYLQLL